MYLSVAELTRLFQAAYEAEVGPYARQIVAGRVLLDWLTLTPEGQDCLILFLEYPQPPQATTLGRAIARIPEVESVRRTLPNYRSGGGRRVNIFKRHEHQRPAPLAEIARRLQLDEWLLGDYVGFY